MQHFEVGDVITIKVPGEDKTSTDIIKLFGLILDEPNCHRYKVLTFSGAIKRLIPTKELNVVNKALQIDIVIRIVQKRCC